MNWYYADAGRQVGPLTEEQFNDLIRTGTILSHTLVWREGMTNWQPHGQVRAGLSANAAGGGIVCVACGKSFPPDQITRVGDAWVCANCQPAFVQGQPPLIGAPVAMSYGGFWIRFVAKLLDGLILMIPLGGLAVVLFLPYIERFQGGRGFPMIPLSLQLGFQFGYFFVAGIYNIFFLGQFGATPGKMALGLQVVTAEGGRISYGRATGRFLAEILSGLICNIGYIIAAFDDQKRALHDHICDTRVIKK